MNREIVTDPLDANDLWCDLKQNMYLLPQMDVAKVLLLFGFAWGNSIYDGDWVDIAVSPPEVEQQILDAEQKNYGCLGADNLYISVPNLDIRLQYSYESVIHLSYSKTGPFVETVYSRWVSSDWFIESKKKHL